MKTTRSYTQRARAESTDRTRRLILDAVVGLSEERLTMEIVLADVAERAGVSVQTVLRHFGTKDGLFEATRSYRLAQVREERRAPVGDVTATVATIVDHYERAGDWVLAMLAREHVDDSVRRLVEHGRAMHREWVIEVFAPWLAGSEPDGLTDLLVVATDLYTWKLLRRDTGHDQGTTTELMLRLVRAVLPARPGRN